MGEDKSVFDLDAALKAVDGHLDILRELVQVFLDHHQRLIDEFVQAAARKDFEALAASVHDIRGCVGFYRCQRLQEAMEDIHACTIGKNAEGVAAHSQRVQDEFARLVPELRRFLNEGADPS